MGIKIDENIDKAVTYDNPPEVERTLFKNLPEGGGGGVEDVQINGTSILNEGVANIPIASSSKHGVVLVSGDGLGMVTGGRLRVNTPQPSRIKEGTQLYQPVDIYHQHEAVFYGLAKAAGDGTQSASSNNVGQYTEDAKNAIKTMLGISSYNERITLLYIVWDSDSSSYVVYEPQGITLDMQSINPVLRLITAQGDNMSNFVEFSLIKSETTDPDYETTFNPVTVLTFRSLEPTWFNKIVTITYEWYMPFEESTISVSTLS